jgi:L-threonylcarbamoyladenylate synthase
MSLHLSVPDPASPDRPLMVAAEVIQAGGLVVYPTDTVYGIGADPWNADAVGRLKEVKGRDGAKPMLVICPTIESALELASSVSPMARTLMERFWPGPLTLVLRAAPTAPSPVVSASGTIGIRVPDHPVSRRLAELSGIPLISTSANLSGTPAGKTIGEIERDLGNGIDLYLDGGVLQGSLPSTMIDVSSEAPRVLREGALPLSAIMEQVRGFGQPG